MGELTLSFPPQHNEQILSALFRANIISDTEYQGAFNCRYIESANVFVYSDDLNYINLETRHFGEYGFSHRLTPRVYDRFQYNYLNALFKKNIYHKSKRDIKEIFKSHTDILKESFYYDAIAEFLNDTVYNFDNSEQNIEVFYPIRQYEDGVLYFIIKANDTMVRIYGKPGRIEDFREIFNLIKNNSKGDKPIMNANLTPSIDLNFGIVTDANIALSPFGLAIEDRDNNKWLTYNSQTEKVMDVSGLVSHFSGFIYKVPAPVSQIQIGDMIVHQGRYMYVTDVGKKQVDTIDVIASEAKSVLPVTNPWGFDFITKIVSFVNMNSTPNPQNPFGNIGQFMLMDSIFGQNDGGNNPFNCGNDVFKSLMSMSMMSQMLGGMGGEMNPFSSMFNVLGLPVTDAVKATEDDDEEEDDE